MARIPTDRRKYAALLVIAILACFVVVQTAAALATHPDDEGSGHCCCAACHGGHYPVLQTARIVHVAILAVARWHVLLDEEQHICFERQSENDSRGPPVLA